MDNLKKKLNKAYHTSRAYLEATRNGGMKSKQKTKYGVQYNYKNGTGYWVDR